MGIGNTTAASALVAVMTGRPPADVTGRGTGLDDPAVHHKVVVIERALERQQPDPTDPIGVLAAVGGLEIAALVGAILASAEGCVPVLLDGFITGAAALLAHSGQEPADLRRQVTSPGGTTEAALNVLLSNTGLPPLLREAVAAAVRRSKELG